MFLLNSTSDYRKPLTPIDAQMLGLTAGAEAERHLSLRKHHIATPLIALPDLAARLGVGAVHVKDEGQRLGLGSFKALGGAHAVICLVLEKACEQLGRAIDISQLQHPEVRAIASNMTFTCATDGNHGRSVAQGAQLVGARAAIFVHSRVSDARVAAIASFAADVIRVEGSYDETVREAARVAADNHWVLVSDTSWPGYERIPGLVMQGYTVLVREALRQLPQPPTHVFVQSGVGGIAAAVSGYLALALGAERPVFTVVDPARAACIVESARAGHPVTLTPREPTVMAMLECYEPSLVAWRVLSRAADAFMTVDEEDALSIMRQLANPVGKDPVIFAGESGGVGLAGLVKALAEPAIKSALGLNQTSRVFLVNTEGATDPFKYEQIVGRAPG